MLKINKKIIIIIFIIIIIAFFLLGYNIYTNDYESEDLNVNKTESIEEKDNNQKSKIKIYITGSVINPGVIEVDEGCRIADAIEIAGGLKEDSDISSINLATLLEDGVKVYIPNQNETKEITEVENNVQNSIEPSIQTKTNEKININKASKNQLESLPGIGAGIADNIITYRKEKGAFKKIEDLKNVKGIGTGKFDKIKDLISIK